MKHNEIARNIYIYISGNKHRKEDGIVNPCRSPLISGKGGQRYNCESRMLIDSIGGEP